MSVVVPLGPMLCSGSGISPVLVGYLGGTSLLFSIPRPSGWYLARLLVLSIVGRLWARLRCVV